MVARLRFIKITRKNTLDFLKTNRYYILFFILLFFVLIINTLHFYYPDEFDNIVGGHFILHGRFPYSGFFTHHGPFAYLLAAVINIFSGDSFVRFRFIYAFFLFLAHLLFFIFIKKRFGTPIANIVLIFSTFIAIMATYVWGHMLLADSLVGYLITPVYILLLTIALKKQTLRTTDLWIVSILSACAFLTSITFVYAIIVIYCFTIFLFFRNNSQKISITKIIKLLSILAMPYLVFLIYLIVTRSLPDYVYQAIVFNSKYYINPEDGGGSNNPLRVGLIIFNNVFDRFRAILIQVKDFNLGNPFAPAMALGSFLFILYLLMNRKFSVAIFAILLLVYLNSRSNPLTTKETDYQGIPYHYFSLFNGIFLMTLLWQHLKEKTQDNLKMIYSVFFILLGLYMTFLSLQLFQSGFDKAFRKYMGTQALIYDRPSIAPTLNSILDKNDYYYIGPFSYEEHYYMKSKLASRYFITIPAMDKSDKIKGELLVDLEKNKPKVIVFNTEYHIFSMKPGTFLQDYIAKNYFNLEQLKNEGVKFSTKHSMLGDYDFKRHFYFNKTDRNQLLSKLSEQGLITFEQ